MTENDTPTGTEPPRPGTPSGPGHTERTSWSPGLVAFYAGCGFVSLGAAVLFSGILVFPEYDFYTAVVVIGGLMIAAGGAAMWLGLRAARNE